MYEISNSVPQDIRAALNGLLVAEDKLDSAREQINLRIIDVSLTISRYFQSNPIII